MLLDAIHVSLEVGDNKLICTGLQFPAYHLFLTCAVSRRLQDVFFWRAAFAADSCQGGGCWDLTCSWPQEQPAPCPALLPSWVWSPSDSSQVACLCSVLTRALQCPENCFLQEGTVFVWSSPFSWGGKSNFQEYSLKLYTQLVKSAESQKRPCIFTWALTQSILCLEFQSCHRNSKSIFRALNIFSFWNHLQLFNPIKV